MKKTPEKNNQYINKENLIMHVSELTRLSKADSARALEAFAQAIQNGLKEEKKINLSGFGTFSVTLQAEKKGRNPRTGQEITIPATKRVKFQARKDLKENIS
jgi:DNA-binding protein HU-beta